MVKPNTTIKLNYIDSLIGLAILVVIMFHTSLIGNVNLQGFPDYAIRQGARGVQLFFIVSAFTLFLSSEKRFDKERFPTRNFFIRRFFRIAPMYYLAIVYFLLQNGFTRTAALGDQAQITASNIIANIFFVHSFYPYWFNSLVPGGWSIGVEMMFYCFLPLAFSRIKNITNAVNFFVLTVLTAFVLDWFFRRHVLIASDKLWREYLYYYFPSQLPIFALGIISFFIVNENHSSKNLSGRSLIGVTFLLTLHLLFIRKYMLLQYHVQFGVAFLLLVVAVSRYRFTLVVNNLSRYLGKISFSMYFVHFAVLHWLTYFEMADYFSVAIINYPVRLVIVLVLTVLISVPLYNFIEVPFQRLGSRLINKLETKK
jgi:peptidoglycan/LPS O-acetylase OafA/YrhL